MKTILKNGTYYRVRDEMAERDVIAGKAKYVPKSEWKAVTRKKVEIIEQKQTNKK